MEIANIIQHCRDLVTDKKEFDTITDLVSRPANGLFNTAKFYFLLAEIFAEENRLCDSMKCYEYITKQFPNKTQKARKIQESLVNGYAEIQGCHFILDSPTISDYMKIKIADGGYEIEELSLVKQFIHPNDKILELGCGIGFMGIICKKLMPTIDYVAFEANPHLIDLIHRNQELNDVVFDIQHAVLDDFDGETDFYLTKDYWASSLIRPENFLKQLSVPVKEINRTIQEGNINFLIMDIEGGEKDLIAKIDLDSIDKLVMELHPHLIGDEETSKILSYLKSQELHIDESSTIHNVAYFCR